MLKDSDVLNHVACDFVHGNLQHPLQVAVAVPRISAAKKHQE